MFWTGPIASLVLLTAFSSAQIKEVSSGSGPQVPKCVDKCRLDFFNTTGIERDCYSGEWPCNCKYTLLWDYMACCIQAYCGDIDVEDADSTLRGFCTSINVEGEFPSLLKCKGDEGETTSTASKSTKTTSRREPSETAQPKDSTKLDTTTSQPSSTSEAVEAAATAGDGQNEETEDSDSSQSSTMALGVGLGVGIPICALGLSIVAFLIWRRRKARGRIIDSPASADYSTYSAGAKTPMVGPESSSFIHELHSESRRAELPG